MDKDLLADIAKDITKDDMPNADMKLVAEYCGTELALRLMEHLAGVTLYVPHNRFLPLLEKYITKNHKRVDVKRLALVCGVTETFVYNVIRRAKNTANQTRLFDQRSETITRVK
jgi:Mor family transcriptional regulator